MAEQHLAIIFSDIKRYSSIQSDKIYSLINTALNNFINANLDSNNIVYYKKTGDGLIICSTSSLFAANIALKLRDYFFSLNWKEEDCYDDIIPRISVHFGLIQSHNDKNGKIEDITGHDVIFAARIEPITPPGMIYCSKQLHEQLLRVKKNNTRTSTQGVLALAKNFGKHEIFRLSWEHEPR